MVDGVSRGRAFVYFLQSDDVVVGLGAEEMFDQRSDAFIDELRQVAHAPEVEC